MGDTAATENVRSYGKVLLLVLVTFGLYGVYWWYTVYNELLEEYPSREFPTGLFIASILIPFVILLYAKNVIEDLQAARQQEGLDEGVTFGTFVLWLIPGLLILVGPFVAYYKLQTSFNELWRAGQGATQPAPEGQAPAGA